jgi:hypothetical protein
MASSFNPPSDDRLAEVDRADCEYNNKCVEIQGVVSPSGQGGWPRTREYKVHCFSLAAWRRIAQPIVNRTLTILQPVAVDSEDYSAFPACSIHRIRILLSKDETRGIFASELSLDGTDAELIAISQELQRPVVMATSRFGELNLDREIERFEGEVEWNGGLVGISFDTDDKNRIELLIKTADVLWDSQSEWKQKVTDFAIEKLLPLKNDYWLDEDEEPLTADQFKSLMELDSISISADGKFDFWHNDGAIFCGHAIQISGSLSDGLTCADIPG